MKYNLSVIIPLYNEEDIVGKNVKKIIDKLGKMGLRWEVILVNDGSKDGTLSIIRNKFLKNENIKIINFKINKGKGAAIRAGVKKSKGDFVIFSDIDLATPLKHLDEMINKFKEGYDLVIGSRKTLKSKIIRHQPFYREVLGKGFTFITKKILGVNISDFTCGFKGFKKKAAKKIFPKGKIDRWAFDAEILFIANIFGYKIVEIPVSWRDRRETKVRLWVDLPRSFCDIIKIKYSYLTGRYEK